MIALVSRVNGIANVYSKEVRPLVLTFLTKDVEEEMYEQALVAQSSTHKEGKIVDPKNGEEFTWDQVRKVYII